MPYLCPSFCGSWLSHLTESKLPAEFVSPNLGRPRNFTPMGFVTLLGGLPIFRYTFGGMIRGHNQPWVGFMIDYFCLRFNHAFGRVLFKLMTIFAHEPTSEGTWYLTMASLFFVINVVLTYCSKLLEWSRAGNGIVWYTSVHIVGDSIPGK